MNIEQLEKRYFAPVKPSRVINAFSSSTANEKRFLSRDQLRQLAPGEEPEPEDKPEEEPGDDAGAESEEVVIEGFAALYNTPVQIREWGEEWVEYLAPGCFGDTLNDPNADILSCFNHDFNQPLGRRSSGTAKFEDRPEGLWTSIRLAECGIGAFMAEMIDRKDICGQSIMFQVTAESWDFTPKLPIRTIQRLVLYEAGPVLFPACGDTSIAVARMRAAREEYRAKSGGTQISGNSGFHRRNRAAITLKLAEMQRRLYT